MSRTIAPWRAVRPARPIADSLADLIGGTPLLRLRLPVDAAPGVQVLAKLESANPLSSSKDRAALWMIEAAERAGLLRPGGVVVESTSGNTGIALAALCASRGYGCVIVMPDSATHERVDLVRALGARVELTPHHLRLQGAIDRAEQLTEQIPGAWYSRQHENLANRRAHYETTGPEIWADTAGRVDVVVCGVGTGGTLCGAASYLKSRDEAVHAVAVEPEGSALLSGRPAGTHAIPGMNGGFIAPVTDRSVIDEVMTVGDEDAITTARRLAREQGVLAGISSGAVVDAALRIARRADRADHTIVAVLADTGERYLSVWGPPEEQEAD